MDKPASRLSEILNDIDENSQIIKEKLKLEQEHIAELQSIIEHDVDNIQQSSSDRPALVIVYSGQYEEELESLAKTLKDKRIGKDLQRLIEQIKKFREEFASNLKKGWYINDEEKKAAIIKFVEDAKKILYDLFQAQEDIKEAEGKFSSSDV